MFCIPIDLPYCDECENAGMKVIDVNKGRHILT